MAAKGSIEKEPMNFVHKNAILCETVNKENRTQKLYTNYSINPFKPLHVIAGKPNSKYDSEDGEEDPHFKKIIARANQEPTKKFTTPQTEAQEIGWVTRPLLEKDRGDRRLSFPHQMSEMTKYMETFWRIEEAKKINTDANTT
ncbi:cilia- and flagella-associated protein 144-like [Watersipora subatra]|uniref:cilia- and flagella-associated protein 144-like n=1 Tax=Watersipora subatra TaxID=2589382 RepID=UPI00355C3797